MEDFDPGANSYWCDTPMGRWGDWNAVVNADDSEQMAALTRLRTVRNGGSVQAPSLASEAELWIEYVEARRVLLRSIQLV